MLTIVRLVLRCHAEIGRNKFLYLLMLVCGNVIYSKVRASTNTSEVNINREYFLPFILNG
jgi:hypothetical protein